MLFTCDYLEGAHPKIMERLMETNIRQTIGYSEDVYCQRARTVIKEVIDREGADVHFLVGGTQTNMSVIAASLRPHHGVFSAASGHINVHETGAIEATGHKVLALETGSEGKLTAAQVERAYLAHITDETHEHMVKPHMVYISNPTENGCVYTKAELVAMREVCDRYGLLLYLDGARLGYGLVSPCCDLQLRDLARLCDAFYIGGTKQGALFGEVVVLINPEIKSDFRYLIKQRGGMLAKGRLLGIQFETLFTDNLYFEISKGAVDRALHIARTLENCGFELLTTPQTNQIFPILTRSEYELLAPRYGLEWWKDVDAESKAFRICTSWATTDEMVSAIESDICSLRRK